MRGGRRRGRGDHGEGLVSDVRARSGKDLSAVTLDAVTAGELGIDDVRIHPETLLAQAEVAERAGNPQLGQNFRRAAELTLLGDERVLAIYEALRPHRSTGEELEAIAAELDAAGRAVQRRPGPGGGRGLPQAGPAAVRLAAGVDIGNTTTEIVVADLDADPPAPVVWDRRPTRGVKGSLEAAQGAARLLDRLERRAGAVCGLVLLTPQAPARTLLVGVDRAAPDTGRLRLLAAGSPTPAGAGYAVGRPVPVEDDPASCGGDEPVVLVATDPMGFRRTAARVELLGAGGASDRRDRAGRGRGPAGCRAHPTDGADRGRRGRRRSAGLRAGGGGGGCAGRLRAADRRPDPAGPRPRAGAGRAQPRGRRGAGSRRGGRRGDRADAPGGRSRPSPRRRRRRCGSPTAPRSCWTRPGRRWPPGRSGQVAALLLPPADPTGTPATSGWSIWTPRRRWPTCAPGRCTDVTTASRPSARPERGLGRCGLAGGVRRRRAAPGRGDRQRGRGGASGGTEHPGLPGRAPW